jgi:RNA polymerase sigma-70 factor, ECF subfamily
LDQLATDSRDGGRGSGGEEIEAIEDPRDPVAQAIEMGPLCDALRGLTPPLREAVIAVDVVGLSYKDAARALRTKEGTVMSRLHRGRSRIAQQLGT